MDFFRYGDIVDVLEYLGFVKKANFGLRMKIKVEADLAIILLYEKKVAKGLESQRKICIFVEILSRLVEECALCKFVRQAILIYKNISTMVILPLGRSHLLFILDS